MSEVKDNFCEDHKKEPIQTEVDKLKAKIQEIEKKIKDKENPPHDRVKQISQIIGWLLGAIVLVFALVSILIPLTRAYNDFAKVKTELSVAQAELKEVKLLKKVDRITSRLDSCKKSYEIKLDKITTQLEKEKSKNLPDQKIVKNLESKRDETSSRINRIEQEKQEIKSIIKPLIDFTISIHGFDFQTHLFKIFLNNTLKATTTKYINKLKAEEGVYKLNISYKDNANNIWEFKEDISINSSSPQININRTEFDLIH